MLISQTKSRCTGWAALCALGAVMAPWTLVHAGKAIQELRAADPQGEVEIVNVSGLVEVSAWDRSEVEVRGTAGSSVDRVDVTSAGNRTSVHVVLAKAGRSWGTDYEAHLMVHVPAKSTVTATLVSADFKVTGVSGNLKVQAVSGTVSGDVGGDIYATTVSGDVRLSARAAKTIEVQTISGDIQLTGGGGEVDVSTVSGGASVDLAEVSRGRFKSVSGDVTAALTLAPDAQIDSQSVSGDVGIKFASPPAAEFDVQSFSGDIKNCFGPKAIQSTYGPGSRLEFKNGEGHAHVRVNTKSGDVRLCVKGMNGAHSSALSLARVGTSPLRLPYVY